MFVCICVFNSKDDFLVYCMNSGSSSPFLSPSADISDTRITSAGWPLQHDELFELGRILYVFTSNKPVSHHIHENSHLKCQSVHLDSVFRNEVGLVQTLRLEVV